MDCKQSSQLLNAYADSELSKSDQSLLESHLAECRDCTREFCERYGGPLYRVAAKHLPDRVRRRVGPEDVAQSACRTFLRRAEGGEFQLADAEGLWQLLCAITLTKVREQTRFHLRQKRGLDREFDPDPTASGRSQKR